MRWASSDQGYKLVGQLKEAGWLDYQLLAFFFFYGPPKVGHTEIHSWATSLLPSSDQGDKLVGLVMSGYV
jgi:hypothetical protein